MTQAPTAADEQARISHMRLLVDTLQHLERKLREGGGAQRAEKQHKAENSPRANALRNSSIPAPASLKPVS